MGLDALEYEAIARYSPPRNTMNDRCAECGHIRGAHYISVDRTFTGCGTLFGMIPHDESHNKLGSLACNCHGYAVRLQPNEYPKE